MGLAMFERRELIKINTILLYLCQIFGINHRCTNCEKLRPFFVYCSDACIKRSIVDVSKKICSMFKVKITKIET